MYDNVPATASLSNKYANQALAQTAAIDSPREANAAELIHSRLLQYRDHLSNNTQRVVEIGSRAFGGSPVGAKGETNAKVPHPAGTVSAISAVLEDIQNLLMLQSDAISYAEKIA